MTHHVPPVQLSRPPLAVCSSNLEEELQGSVGGEKWGARLVQASKDGVERGLGPSNC